MATHVVAIGLEGRPPKVAQDKRLLQPLLVLFLGHGPKTVRGKSGAVAVDGSRRR
jgi:hypothetical protein